MSNGARLFTGHLRAAANRAHAFRVAHVAGVTCFTSARLDLALFNRALVLTATQVDRAVLERVARHYERQGRTAVIEIPHPWLDRGARRELAAAGFQEDAPGVVTHVLRGLRRPPAEPRTPGLVVLRQTREASARYARLATRGFGGGSSPISRVFERGWTEMLRGSPRTTVAFVGSVGAEEVATGVLSLRSGVGGLYSGSVLRPYRGRGIHAAMIAARIAFGYERGLRAFYSQTEDADTPSAHNLADMGFRHLFRAVRFVRRVRRAFSLKHIGDR